MKINKNKVLVAAARNCQTMKDVCQKAALSRMGLHRALLGKEVMQSTVGKIAAALGVDVLEILEGDA